MPTLRVEAHLSCDELLQAVEQLNLPELEQFTLQVIALQAQRKAPNLSKDEATLLLKINQGIPSELQDCYDQLIAKRQSETLTPEEYSQLLSLSDRIEALEAKRIEYIAELARLRQTSLTSLMAELGIQPPADQ